MPVFKCTVPLDQICGALFDLDGVLTQTAKIHARAWKETFDPFLRGLDPTSSLFDANEEYRRHVDGKPRYDGVQDFLAARGIQLPYGDRADAPGEGTVCALGNRKQALFLALISQGEVQAFQDAAELIVALRTRSIPIGVVTSSRNGKAIIEAAGLGALVDYVADGTMLDVPDVKGKPAPDMYLEAARNINVPPGECLVVEDAAAGVAAAVAGEFGMIVGIRRTGRSEDLVEAGAHCVVTDLGELALSAPAMPFRSAMWAVDALARSIRATRGAVFLDYDGTLTPIIAERSQAYLSSRMTHAIAALAAVRPVGIISGRDLDNLRERVDLPGVVLSGSHGFEALLPTGHWEYEPALPSLDTLARMERFLRAELARIEGIELEPKRFALTVHFRHTPSSLHSEVDRITLGALGHCPGLRRTGGKAIFEFRPDVEWNKGTALTRLANAMGVGAEATVLYIGDDETDEDAFSRILPCGVGVLVSDPTRPSAAQLVLRDPDDVCEFIEALTERLGRPA